MKFAVSSLVAALTLIVGFEACSGTQRASLLPAGTIAQAACPTAERAGFGKSHVVPELDNVIIKSCTYRGDPCECYYNGDTGDLAAHTCVASYNPLLGIATAGGNLVYGGFGTTIVISDGRKKIARLKGLTGDAIGLAVDHFGNVWATNSPSTTISEFAKGATKPTATYTDSNLVSASYLAVDAAGDLYVEGQASYAIEVDVLPVGGSTFTPISQPDKVGITAGGLTVQNTSTTTYVWINDQGSANIPPRITRYVLKGSSLYSQGSITYSGVNGAIWADPAGEHLSRIWAANNVPYGSGYNTSAVEYAMPSGKIVRATSLTASSTQAVGIAGTFQ